MPQPRLHRDELSLSRPERLASRSDEDGEDVRSTGDRAGPGQDHRLPRCDLREAVAWRLGDRIRGHSWETAGPLTGLPEVGLQRDRLVFEQRPDHLGRTLAREEHDLAG